MRILFIGDIVGSLGRTMLEKTLPNLKRTYHPQVTIVNGENAAAGRGITEKIYRELLNSGVDAVTLGNHTWDNRSIYEFIDSAKKMVRPANFPQKTTPGTGLIFIQVNQVKLAVINVQARTFMQPTDDPFAVVDDLIKEAKKETSCIFVDFHGEATSEKIAMGWNLDGMVSAVIGTHTHVQTNDGRILPQGTAYLTDVGMTGPYDGILGMKKEAVIEKFKTGLPHRFEVVDEGNSQLSYCVIDVNDETGKSTKIEAHVVLDDGLWEIDRGKSGW